MISKSSKDSNQFVNPCSQATAFISCLQIPLDSDLTFLNSKVFDQTAQMHRLVGAMSGCISFKHYFVWHSSNNNLSLQVTKVNYICLDQTVHVGRLVWACLEAFLLIIKLRCLKYSRYLKVDGNTLRGINFVILIWPPCSVELNS